MQVASGRAPGLAQRQLGARVPAPHPIGDFRIKPAHNRASQTNPADDVKKMDFVCEVPASQTKK